MNVPRWLFYCGFLLPVFWCPRFGDIHLTCVYIMFIPVELAEWTPFMKYSEKAAHLITCYNMLS